MLLEVHHMIHHMLQFYFQNLQFLHCHQNILTDNVLIGMVQNFFRRLGFQEGEKMV